jgi:carboxypeptidase PM20D1
MKRVMLFLLLAFLALFVVLSVRALRAGSGANRDAAAPLPAPLAEVDTAAVARHLGEAIRFETVSQDGVAHANADAFLALHAWLERTYPSVHASMQRETVNGESLLYTWRGDDPGLAPVALLAHMDVVPVEEATLQDWIHPPFSGVIADGAVWGRGALDMKSTMVSLMEAAEILTQRGFRPPRTIYFAFGHDEEVSGRAGAAQLAATLAARGVRLAWVLDEGGAVVDGAIPGVDGPIAMIAVAEKGYLTLEIEASADGGHSSTPPPETAVGRLAEAILRLEANPFPARVNAITGETIERIGAVSSFGVRLVTANRWLFDPLIAWAMTLDPTLAAMARTTTAPTMLEASPQENVLAQHATARVNFRLVPGDDVASLTTRVREIVGGERIAVSEPTGGSNPSSVSPTDSDAFLALERSAQRVFPGTLILPSLMMAATDSRQYAEVTDATYRFAGMRIDLDQTSLFHGTNERIPVDALGPMVQFHVDLMEHGLQPDEAR